jgi:glycosyltransferase involved in cell wall biosynthesis
MNRISACLITLNEERNIRRCLDSVQGIADEIIVVDSGSKDRTAEIAREFGANVIVNPWTNFRDQKNFAADHASHEWILSLDADEELSCELRNELTQWKKKEPDYSVYEFARRTWYLGAWIRHTRWYPDFQRKLYRRDKTRFEAMEHAAPKYDGTVGRLGGDLLHYTVHSFEEHAAKLEGITSRLAEQMFAEGRRDWRAAMWLATPWSWLNNFILCFGFLDGRRGWIISRMAARGTWLKFKKLGKLVQAERKSAGQGQS